MNERAPRRRYSPCMIPYWKIIRESISALSSMPKHFPFGCQEIQSIYNHALSHSNSNHIFILFKFFFGNLAVSGSHSVTFNLFAGVEIEVHELKPINKSPAINRYTNLRDFVVVAFLPEQNNIVVVEMGTKTYEMKLDVSGDELLHLWCPFRYKGTLHTAYFGLLFLFLFTPWNLASSLTPSSLHSD